MQKVRCLIDDDAVGNLSNLLIFFTDTKNAFYILRTISYIVLLRKL
jgi:hypothetical protein